IRDYKTDKYITYIPKVLAKRFCNADDIMIGRYGPPIFQILKGIEGSFNVALMKATPLMGNKEFIRYFLKQDCLLHYLESMSKRTAGQDGIQMDKLKAYPFPMPPIELQNQFADFVEQTEKTKSAVKKVLEKAETLKKALMQEYFT
ncbi:MAG: restriction endonuclease subunit S, partial [Ruminococcus sp.]|nr:restriction endonuclease subunit S [Ruminococcus sp.]